MRERDLERRLVKAVAAVGGKAFKLSAQWDAGLPDRLVCLPGGKVIFAELKAEGQRPRPIQVSMHRKLRALGFAVFVIDSKEGIKTLLEVQNDKANAD